MKARIKTNCARILSSVPTSKIRIFALTYRRVTAKTFTPEHCTVNLKVIGVTRTSVYSATTITHYTLPPLYAATIGKTELL